MKKIDICEAVENKGFRVIRIKQWHPGENIYVTIAGGRKELYKASALFNDTKVETDEGTVGIIITVRA